MASPTKLSQTYKNTKVKVRSPDGDTDFFDIVADVLQGDTLTSYLLINCLGYVLRMSTDLIKESGFAREKTSSRQHSEQTITDVDYEDNLAILANTRTQDEALLHNLEQVAGGIGLDVNADKTSTFVLIKKRRHLHTKWWFSETSGQVHISRK